ncbi:MAG: hypothetical protein FRX48_01260 [Lasallia pustulata]|uniref:Uncharacterized protein n=1 Tax=Lasallia pustulata TaxID=136370 RepID=A0A5M8PXQ5_9LECA|nr:MAG: hypothetical protein FRX48_01260 [Lasallia pustulata]
MRVATRPVASISAWPWPIPIFLCPFLASSANAVQIPLNLHAPGPQPRARRLHIETARGPEKQFLKASLGPDALPWSCPGCGALTQTLEPKEAGFYSTTRKSVKAYIANQTGHGSTGRRREAEIYTSAVKNVDGALLKELGLEDVVEPGNDSRQVTDSPKPVCDRCHDLLHHHSGAPIIHPTLQSIQEIISLSPYKYNHIYHVLDAADFPLSLIPSLQHHLNLLPQRSANRRSRTGKFHHGRKAEMSFLITRSDLLAPKKEQVDALMPYLVQVLRDALGASGQDVRLGNVRCVSSKRGWWTKQLKEDIWNRGGGGWMVGKVNVGKSNLFQNVFPKGRNEDVKFGSLRQATSTKGHDEATMTPVSEPQVLADPETSHQLRRFLVDEPNFDEDQTPYGDSLLPPAQVETAFPVMPVISSLPGTTASPIRLPFGGGKGELIDLPGLSRGSLEEHVEDGHKLDLVMQHRLSPEQQVLKAGQSLLVGGLIRITPTTPDIVVLAYPFVPVDVHVTSTEKAIAIHTQQQATGVPTITVEGAGDKMASAGLFELRWDVTKQRAGPLTSSTAVGLKASILPFVVLSTDILIEGCGWVELVAQVRRKDLEQSTGAYGAKAFPVVEVFSPYGKHVGVRRPMNAWLLGGPKPVPRNKRTTRPRRSMKGAKKALKMERRAAESKVLN